MKKVLVFGFEKFDRLNSNPSEDLAKKLAESLDNVNSVVLPTNFGNGGSWDVLREAIEEHSPEIVIGMGVSGRPRVTVETFGINMVDSPKPDNNGVILRNKKIDESAPLAYEATISPQEITDFLKVRGIPAAISYSAETYVCNFTYYNLLHYLKDKETKAIFIHVPTSPEIINELDVNFPSYPIEPLFNALKDYISQMK